MLVTFSMVLNWRRKSADGWEISTSCLQSVWGLLSSFFQESDVDKSRHHATLCTFSKSLFCPWFNSQMVEWLKWNILQVSLRLVGYLCEDRKLYDRFSSDSVDMRLGTSAKTWNLIHLSIILWIKNWIVEKALRFFSWMYHLFITSVILGFAMNYSEL